MQAASQMKVLSRAVRPRLMYRTTVMPPTPTRVHAYDTEQRKMIAAAMRLRCLPDDTPEVYCRRRNRQASQLLNTHGRWSTEACKAFCHWDLHLKRDTANNLWVARILRTRDAAWLQQQREKYGANSGRTGTRVLHGHVARRWEAAALFARAHLSHSQLRD